MADSLLNSSISAVRTKIINDIATASVKDLVSLARAAKALGLGDDADVENAINTRVNSFASSASVSEIKDLSQAIKQVKNEYAATINNADDISDGATNKFLSTSNLNTELGSLSTNIVPDNDVTRNLGSAGNKFNTIYGAKVTGLLSPIDSGDAASKAYVDGQVSGFDPAAVSQSIIPDTNEAYDLGSATNKFRDLYLSSNTLYLGDTTFSSDDILNFDLSVQPETLEIQVADPTAGHGTAWQWTWTQSALPYARTTITNQTQTSVPLYMQGTYQINNFANTQYGSMTQTHAFKLKWIEGAGDDNLIDWVTYSTVDHSHPDINGGNTTSVQRLAVSVPSSITLPTLTAPSVSYTVTAVTGAYVFSGTASGNNPEIGPFYRGGTYTVDINAVGHPFYFTTDNGTGFVAGDYIGEWTSGVTNSRTDNGTITFTVPSNAPDELYYQCGNHANMRGTIRVKDLAVEQNENGNYIIYGQHSQEQHVQKMEIRPIPTLTSQMCLVYDATTSKFVPQDLSTYVENTPAFKNKIKEVAGTATLVAPDGTSLVASVEIYSLESYLPLIGNTNGDIAFAQDTNKLYIWDGSQWITAVADGSATGTGGGISTVTLSQQDKLELITGTARWYAPADITITKINTRLRLPSDGTTTIVVKVDDTTEKTINIAATDLSYTDNNSFSMTEGQYLTIDLTSVGTNPGSDLNVQFVYNYN